MIKLLSAYYLVTKHKNTLLNKKKLFILLSFTYLQRLLRRTIVEVGVFKGGASLLMSIVYGSNYFEKQFLIDPLTGHPPISISKFDSPIHSTGHFSDTSFDLIANLYASYNMEFPNLIAQPVEETTLLKDPIFLSNLGLVHLDTDLFLPTAFSLELLGPSIPFGSVIILDDFKARKCPGIEEAVNQFLTKGGGHNFWIFSWTKEQLILIKKCN